jgi:hypothetical protein
LGVGNVTDRGRGVEGRGKSETDPIRINLRMVEIKKREEKRERDTILHIAQFIGIGGK